MAEDGPKGPKPNTGRTLEPSTFTVGQYGPSRVYPNRRPDNYGQVGTSDVDLSKDGQSPSGIDPAHYRTDTDVSALSLHHTLGSGMAQASPGDHQHDGGASVKIGAMMFNPSFNPALPETASNPKTIPQYVVSDFNSMRAFLHTFCNFRDS